MSKLCREVLRECANQICPCRGCSAIPQCEQCSLYGCAEHKATYADGKKIGVEDDE